MTTEIALATNGNAPALPTPGTAAAAMDMLRSHAEMMQMAYELASSMVKTQMVPAIYRGKPEDATAAILYGLELGLSPIQSLQNVLSVHGKPTVEARTMVALVQAKGYQVWTVESSDTSVTVVGRAPDGREEQSTWTIERADQAGYVAKKDSHGDWVKNGNGKIAGNTKYVTDPRAMLYAKAAAEVCRHLAPDVLLGIAYTREDLESEPAPPEPVRVTSERVTLDDVADKVAAGTPGGVPVKNWQPPAEEAAPASEEVGKQDTAEVPADEVEKPADEPNTSDHADEPLCTTAQQRKLAILLDQHGVTERAAKLAYLGEQFGRTFGSSKELTKTEATQLIDFLSRPIEAADAAKAGE